LAVELHFMLLTAGLWPVPLGDQAKRLDASPSCRRDTPRHYVAGWYSLNLITLCSWMVVFAAADVLLVSGTRRSPCYHGEIVSFALGLLPNRFM
jgi:disulfide bond formation protein DsbB